MENEDGLPFLRRCDRAGIQRVDDVCESLDCQTRITFLCIWRSYSERFSGSCESRYPVKLKLRQKSRHSDIGVKVIVVDAPPGHAFDELKLNTDTNCVERHSRMMLQEEVWSLPLLGRTGHPYVA